MYKKPLQLTNKMTTQLKQGQRFKQRFLFLTWKERNKTTLFIDNTFVYEKNRKNIQKNP